MLVGNAKRPCLPLELGSLMFLRELSLFSGAGGGQSDMSKSTNIARVANGVANRVDRLRALGNGQVPAVARAAWRILTGE